jgi:hypothetical protein
MARMQIVFEIISHVTSHILTIIYLSLIASAKVDKVVVHGVSFSLDTSDFHTITMKTSQIRLIANAFIARFKTL